MKKSFALVLAVIMIVMMFPIQVFAKPNPDNKIKYTITVDADSACGKINVNNQAEEGSNVNAKVEPNDGYTVKSVNVTDENGSKVDSKFDQKQSKLSFRMPKKNVVITVEFEAKIYAITYNEAQHGTVTGPESAGFASEVTVIATPDTGYEIDTITVTKVVEQQIPPAPEAGPAGKKENNNNVVLTQTDTGCVFKMPASNVEVSSTFKKAKYNVTVETPSNGTATASANKAEMGDQITVSLSADTGYRIKSVMVKNAESCTVASKTDFTNDDTEVQYKFTMPAESVTVIVEYTEKIYNITYLEYDHGTLSGDTQKQYNGTVTFTATPDKGYMLNESGDFVFAQDDKLNGISINVNETVFSFTMPASDVKVGADFIGKFILIPENNPNNPEVYDTLQEAVNNAESTDTIIANTSGEAVAKGNKTFRVIENYRAETKITAANGYTLEILDEDTEKGTLYRVSKDKEKIEIILDGIGGNSEEENPATGAPVILLPIAIISLAAVFKRK